MSPGVQLIITVGAVVIAFVSLLGVIYTARSGRAANTEDRDAVWNAGYRAAAEPHLYWDVQMMAVVLQLQQEINEVRLASGLEPKAFAVIPEAPPLYPKFDAKN